MGGPDWVKLLDDYEAAIRWHEEVSIALTEAFASRQIDEAAELHRIEDEAKRTALLARDRLLDLLQGPRR